MNHGPGALRTILIVLGSSGLPLLLTLLRVLVLPSKLGDGGMGMVTLAISFTTFFGIFISLGISTYLVRAVARDNALIDLYIGNALFLRVIMGVVVLGALLGISNLLGYSEETQTVIAIVAVSMVIFTISNVFEAGLQGLGQMSWRAIATAVGQGIATCVGVAMLLLGANATTYALSIPLGMIIQFSIVLSYYFIRRPLKLKLDRSIMWALLAGGMPLFLWGFLQSAYGHIDATLLSLFASEHVVGWFGAAIQITTMLLLIPGAITAVTLPMLCEMHVKSPRDFDATASRTMVSILLIMAPIGAGLAISAADVLRFLPYPAVFLNAAPALALLALALPVTGLMMVMATLAVAIGQEKEWLKISAFAVCIFPPLYIILISWFQSNTGNGATGAALASLLGESILVVWAWLVLPRRFRYPSVVSQGLQVLALTGVMIAAVMVLQSLSLPLFVYVPLGAAIYISGVWSLKLITGNDLQKVREVFSKRKTSAEALP